MRCALWPADSTRAVDVMSKGKEQAVISVGHAQKAGESLKGITQAVSSISDMNTQIATAAEESWRGCPVIYR